MADAPRASQRRGERAPGGRGQRGGFAGVPAPKAPSMPVGEPVDEGQFEQLRRWRWERAEGKPAFTVAANAVLEEVLRSRPGSIEALLEIRGIGPAFCEKHGESLLAALEQLGDVAGEATGRPSSELAPALASGSAPT